MQTCPHLSFPGTCEDALRFYEQVLGAKVEYIGYYKDTPMADQVPPEFGSKVIHATITVGDSRFMASDAPPGLYKTPHGIAMTLESNDATKGAAAFHALTDGGEVHMQLQATYWSPAFGMGRDKFGIPWMVNVAQQS